MTDYSGLSWQENGRDKRNNDPLLMSTILPQAQALVSTLKTLMPSIYQQDSLQALLGLFLAERGTSLPEHCQIKSEECFESVLE